ncbi:MAG: hypothetical protein LBI01_06065 [Elusimicrobium sp.]|jgi:hypothetical protein|nr:hypothetical protein [Elusimicrobium sp.]
MKKIVKHSNNFWRFLPAIFFAALIFGPFAANFFVSNTETLDNRPLNPRPSKISQNFPLLFDNYYNDAFAYRKNFIRLYNRIRKNAGFSQNEIVINGSGGWLFFDSFKKQGDDDSVGDYLGAVKYSDKEKETALQNLRALNGFAAANNAKYFLFIAPNKENVYSAYMPQKYRSARVSEVSKSDDLINYVTEKSDIKMVNLKPLFLQWENKYPLPLFQKTDTHWNETGAYLALGEMVSYLQKAGFKINIKPFSKVIFTPEEKELGDLGRMINSKEKEYKYLYSFAGSAVCDNENTDQLILKCKSEGKQNYRVLILRDSFGLALIDPMSKMFKETVFLKYPKQQIIKEQISLFKPDIVIEIKVERGSKVFIDRTFTNP